MALYPYIIPSVSSLPAGYECVVFTCRKQLSSKLKALPNTVLRRAKAYADGEMFFSQDDEITLGPGAVVCQGIPPIRIERSKNDSPGYIEVDYVEPNGKPIFADCSVLSEYVVFSADGKKSFFSDSAYKYASPPTIEQIAAFGQFAEGYPVVILNKELGFGETLIVINPYPRNISCSLQASGGAVFPKIAIPPLSAHYVDLRRLLPEGKSEWRGRVQLHSRNRIIAFNIKHKWDDVADISDHEHFDPFRSDPTHMPLTRKARFLFGRFLKNRGISMPF